MCTHPHVCSDGRSRQIAFIGFKTGAQAAEAVRYFNRTFMDTSRLDVTARFARLLPFLRSRQPCKRPVRCSAPRARAHPRRAQVASVAGQPEAVRPWSKYSAGSSRHDAAAAAEAPAATGAAPVRACRSAAHARAFARSTRG